MASSWPATSGAYLSVGAAISALTKNQVVAFVVSVVICFVFTVSGAPMVLDFFTAWAPQMAVDVIVSFSFLAHFQAITDGVIDLRDIIFFATVIGFWLFANLIIVDAKKAG